MSDSDGDQAGVPLIEDISSSDNDQATKKRKRSNEDSAEAKKAARKKKRTLKKPKDIEDESLDAELGVNHAIAHMDSRLLVDHLAQRTKRFKPDLSLMELEDMFVPGGAIVDTTKYEQPRTTENIAPFLEQFAAPRRTNTRGAKKLSDAPPKNGTPHTLVVAGAGLRAADITRALRKFQSEKSMVAKLFAKHIKIKEAIEMVSKTRMGIGVGTPQRLIDLMNDGALSTKDLERIVIDASHIDQKKRGILDMKDTALQLVQLLTRPDLKEKYTKEADDKGVELLFF